MKFLTITPTSTGRQLQIKVKGGDCVVVDKQTQEPIAGVTRWQVDMTPYSIKAKIEIEITSEDDIFYSPEVEGSIVKGLPSYPEQIKKNRESMAELTRLAEESGHYD